MSTSTYYESRYCNECCCQHWVEITRTGRQVCHGDQFAPRDTPTTYTRRAGRGYEVIEKYINQPLDWQIAAEARDSAFSLYYEPDF